MDVAVTTAGPVESMLGDTAGYDHATAVSGDGYRASIPLAMLLSGGVISVEDGRYRLRVEDGSTLCWNVKDVVRFELTVGRAADDVPARPTH